MQDIRTYCLRRALEGATYSQIAKELGVSKNTISGQVDRAKKQIAKGERRMPHACERPEPPTPAMLRLAEFDPVIKRAAELRAQLAA